MATIPGVGYLIVENILEDASYALFQPIVNQTVPNAGIAPGVQTVAVYDPSMYVGAIIVVGYVGSGTEEAVTITALVVGTSFTATFVNNHAGGEPIVGATFPVRQPTDPLFTQAEMLSYVSTAANDFLTDCPMVFAVNAGITVGPTEQNTALPADSLFPVRVASNNYPLKETSQSTLDSMNYRWTQAPFTRPNNYFRDKVPFQNIGIFPRAGNTTPLEVVYAQRQKSNMGLADGFLVPDPFLIYILYKTLSYAFSKDGECRNPGLAKYFQNRYEFGAKASKMFLDSVQDPNLETA